MRRAAALLVLVPLLVATRALAFDASKLEFERSVENVTAPGLHHVEVDPELYRHSRPDGLADVRIVGPDGNEVPWLVRPVPTPQKAERHPAAILESVPLPDGGTRTLIDAGDVKHSELTLTVDAPSGWSRATRLEASSDRTHWTLLENGAWIFSDAGADGTTLHHPVTTARYLRLTLAPGPVPLRLVGATAAFVPPEAHVPLRLLPSVKPKPWPGPEAAPGTWTIDLGAPGVPIAEVALAIDDSAFVREARLYATRDPRAAPVAVRPFSALLYRVAPQPGQEAQENVRIAAGGARTRYLVLTIASGAEPLLMRDVSPAYVAEELVFRAPAAGAYTLYVGGDVPAPRYDTAQLLAGEEPRLSATFGTITPNPTFGHLSKSAPPPSPGHHLRLPAALGLALLLAIAALWALRRARAA